MATRLGNLMIVVLVLGAIAGGCGGGSSGANGAITESSISKPEFIAKVELICERGKTKMAKELISRQKEIAKVAGSEASVAESKLAAEIIQPSIQGQVEEIRSLGAPRGDGDQIEAFTTSLLAAVDTIVRREMSDLSQTLPILRPAGRQALKYGLPECSYGY